MDKENYSKLIQMIEYLYQFQNTENQLIYDYFNYLLDLIQKDLTNYLL